MKDSMQNLIGRFSVMKALTSLPNWMVICCFPSNFQRAFESENKVDLNDSVPGDVNTNGRKPDNMIGNSAYGRSRQFVINTESVK